MAKKSWVTDYNLDDVRWGATRNGKKKLMHLGTRVAGTKALRASAQGLFIFDDIPVRIFKTVCGQTMLCVLWSNNPEVSPPMLRCPVCFP